MMIKDDVVTKVCRKTGYSRMMVSATVDALLDIVTDNLANGNSVQFAGFGTFEPKQCAARTGRNPHTNEEVKIPARVVPNFRAGKYLKAAVIKNIKE